MKQREVQVVSRILATRSLLRNLVKFATERQRTIMHKVSQAKSGHRQAARPAEQDAQCLQNRPGGRNPRMCCPNLKKYSDI